MNIKLIFCATLVTAAFAACSQDEGMAAGQGSESARVGQNSDVEVRLSSGYLSTRSSVESEPDGSFETENIGIYMLATDKIRTNPEEVAPVNWLDSRCIKMTNVETNAVKNALTGVTDLAWADPTATYWYPYENWYGFRFYGYYPRVDDSDITLQSNYIEASYTGLDGTKDIFWGQSLRSDLNDPTEKYRYSAQYFRQAGHANMLPNVSFGHKLMRVQFYIQGVEDENTHSYDMANKMVLDSVVMWARTADMGAGVWQGIPTTASLVIADLENSANEGKLNINWNGSLSTLPMLDVNDQPYLNKKQIHNNEAIKVGQPILLPVPDEGAGTGYLYGAQINLRMVDAEGNTEATFNDASPLDLNLAGSTAYQAGHTYNVYIKISGPQKVTLNATLAPWEEVDDGVDDLDLN